MRGRVQRAAGAVVQTDGILVVHRLARLALLRHQLPDHALEVREELVLTESERDLVADLEQQPGCLAVLAVIAPDRESHLAQAFDRAAQQPGRNERFIPHVIEPSAGADRGTLAFICEAYTYDESRPSPEIMRFHPRLAPIKAAVFPLVNKDGMPEIAEPVYQAIRKRWTAQYDAKASIGKRYARMDEAGTPFCFTIDGQTKEDQTVTIRERDSMKQDRIGLSQVKQYLREKLDL